MFIIHIQNEYLFILELYILHVNKNSSFPIFPYMQVSSDREALL